MRFVPSVLLVLLLAAFSNAANVLRGHSYLRPANNSGVWGTVNLVEGIDGVTVSGSLWGLESGRDYGIHIHVWGDLSDVNGALKVGGHFSTNATAVHGCLGSAGIHNGDLGNITGAGVDSASTFSIVSNLISLNGSNANSVIGRGIVIHANPNPCSGTAYGARISQGVIGVAKPASTDVNVAALKPSTLPNGLVAIIYPNPSYTVNVNGNYTGWVGFSQSQVNTSLVSVQVALSGLPANASRGLHIHQYGDMTDVSGQSAGGHWNPFNATHGCLSNGTSRHAGDLGSIMADADGKVKAWFDVDLLALTGDYNIVGLGVVVHAIPDPCSGIAFGTRQAQGVIGLSNTSYANTNSGNNNGGDVNAASIAQPTFIFALIVLLSVLFM